MQAAMAFAKAGGSRIAAAAGSSSSGKSMGGKSMGGMSRGVSILSSIFEFAGARQKASAIDQEARDEAMAGRQEYITANERVNAIDADYNRLVGDQLAAASAMGIDVGSGSVVAARDVARDEADRERRIIRNSADTNARLRKIRSLNLRAAAKNTRFGAAVTLALSQGAVATGG